jgi:uncharacterized damage-inducible protein DinB
MMRCMTVAGLLADAFGRIQESVADAVEGLDAEQLAARLDADANPVSWLLWHLSRVQDDHVAAAFGVPQVWTEASWAPRLGLPRQTREIGYGHTPAQVAAVSAAICDMPSPGELLVEYHTAVHEQTMSLISGLTEASLDQVVDVRWTPPVTLAVRLVSVINDDTQHIGQALYVRGILLRNARAK